MPVSKYQTMNGRIRRRITTDEEKVTEQVAVVTNTLGSVVATYKDGWLTADRSYDPYGETRAEWNDVGRFGWVGGLGYRETRREWVSHYVRAPHYGYPMGMWTSVDPLWPSQPAFGYVGGRTTRAIDWGGQQSLNNGQPFCPVAPARTSYDNPCSKSSGTSTCVAAFCAAKVSADVRGNLKDAFGEIPGALKGLYDQLLGLYFSKGYTSMEECCMEVNAAKGKLNGTNTVEVLIYKFCTSKQLWGRPIGWNLCARKEKTQATCLACCDTVYPEINGVLPSGHGRCFNLCMNKYPL